ncbi:MAG TPA: glycosyltransferase family 4 protein [Firmicutes bacterium]|nr:glycosyltransferase family 4 protein [Bacillota bacterium]
MKVAWVIRPAAGGIKQHLNYLRRGLSSCCEIIVCGPQELEEWAEGCPFYPIEITDGIEPKQDLKAVWQLTKVLRAVKPELIHIHGLKSVMIAVPAAKLSGVKKTLFTAHNMLPQPQTRWYRATHGLVNRTLLKALGRIIAVSDTVGSELAEFVPYNRIVTIRNGVDYHRFEGYSRREALALMGLDSKHFIIGAVARLIAEKGIACLLKAAVLLRNVLPQMRIVIVGDGPMRHQLELYSQALQLEPYVKFLGFRSDVPALMAGWDLFVLPSLSEGLSVSVLEAMAAKLPVVVSDLPSTREVVEQGKGGYFFAPDNAPGLAAAVLKIAKDQSKKRRMGEHNYQSVIRSFGVDHMIQATKLQYQQLIEEGTVW